MWNKKISSFSKPDRGFIWACSQFCVASLCSSDSKNKKQRGRAALLFVYKQQEEFCLIKEILKPPSSGMLLAPSKNKRSYSPGNTLGREWVNIRMLSGTKMLNRFRNSLHTKLFSSLDTSHWGEKPRASIDPAISSACGQGVTSAAQSFISANLREMVLWQEQAEKGPSLGGGQIWVQLPGAVNGFMPSRQLGSGLCCCRWFSVTPFSPVHSNLTSAGPLTGSEVSAANVVTIYTGVFTVQKNEYLCSEFLFLSVSKISHEFMECQYMQVYNWLS